MRVAGQPVEDGQDPLAAVKSATAMGEETSVLVLENFHRFLGSPEIVQAMASQLHAGKQNRSIVVVLAPVLELPPELEKMFVAIEHLLPDRVRQCDGRWQRRLWSILCGADSGSPIVRT